MCLITIAPPGTDKYSDHIKSAIRTGMTSQRDGTGFAYWRAGTDVVEYSKGYFLKNGPFELFWNLLEELDLQDNDIFMIHHRTGTSGLTTAKNCHPFLLSPKNCRIDDIAKISGSTKDGVLMHNGIFTRYTKFDDDLSDTANLTHQLFTSSINNINLVFSNPKNFQKTYDNLIGYNKLALLRPGQYVTIGDFIKDERGLYHSNRGYEDYRMRDVGGSSFSARGRTYEDIEDAEAWAEYIESNYRNFNRPIYPKPVRQTQLELACAYSARTTQDKIESDFKEDEGDILDPTVSKPFKSEFTLLPETVTTKDEFIDELDSSPFKPDVDTNIGKLTSNPTTKALEVGVGNHDGKSVSTNVDAELMIVIKRLRSDWERYQAIFQELIKYNHKYAKYFVFIPVKDLKTVIPAGSKLSTDNFNYFDGSCTVTSTKDSRSTYSVVSPRELLQCSTLIPKSIKANDFLSYAELHKYNNMFSNKTRKFLLNQLKKYGSTLNVKIVKLKKPIATEVTIGGVEIYDEMFNKSDGILVKVEHLRSTFTDEDTRSKLNNILL